MATSADSDFRHRTSPEIKAMLDSDEVLAEKWQALTARARNEWISWTISAKHEATRGKHRARLHEEVLEGKKRPCCWR